jgi:hypothetical protein
MDVLVSICVIGVLVSLMTPALSGIRETTRRVVCSSNVRQVGMGVSMFADAHRGMLPPTVTMAAGARPRSATAARGAAAPAWGPADAQVLRLPASAGSWDGLGLTYAGEYIPNPAVFYCPSHRGEHPFARYARDFTFSGSEIFGNYQFRGLPSSGAPILAMYPDRAGLIADGMRTASDVNHVVGANVLSGDMSVAWFTDSSEKVLAALPNQAGDAKADERVLAAWSAIDTQIAPQTPTGSGTGPGRNPFDPTRNTPR